MRATRTRAEAAASSRTYRKASNLLARETRVGVQHTRRPHEDFVDMVERVRTRMDEKALTWYRRGIVRGITYAADRVLDGTITLQNGTLRARRSFNLRVKIKIDGREERHKIKTKAREAGFR